MLAAMYSMPEGNLNEEPDVPYMTSGVGCNSYRQTVLDRANGIQDNNGLGSIWVDDAIGALMQHLEALGQLGNTFFLFQMDHGQEGKGSLYEPGIHMVTFVHYPDEFEKGSSFEGLTSTIDIGATVLDFAGVDKTANGYYEIDGESWRNAVGTDLETAWKERCIVSELGWDRAVVCGCDKYIRIEDIENSDTTDLASRAAGLASGSEVLFDLCDSSHGKYLTIPAESPEKSDVVHDSLSSFQAVLNCHLQRSSPMKTADYGSVCSRSSPGDPDTCEATGIFANFKCK